jgi:hypothetical protein
MKNFIPNALILTGAILKNVLIGAGLAAVIWFLVIPSWQRMDNHLVWAGLWLIVLVLSGGIVFSIYDMVTGAIAAPFIFLGSKLVQPKEPEPEYEPYLEDL